MKLRSTFSARGALVVSSMLAGSAALAACGGGAAEQKPAASSESRGASPDAAKRHEQVRALLEDARVALKESGPGAAREKAEEARRMAGPEDLTKVLNVIQYIDAKEVEGIATEAKQLADGGKCTEALDTVASPVKKSSTKLFLANLHTATADTLVACVQKLIDEAIEQGEFAKARAVLDSPSATAALSDEAWKDLRGKLSDGIIARVTAKIDVDLKAGKYADAIAKIDQAVQKGDVGPDEQENLYESIRKLVAPRQVSTMSAALGSTNKPSVALDDTNTLVRLLKWKDLPPDLDQVRKALDVRIEVVDASASAQGKPAIRYTYGRVEMHAPDENDSEKTAIVQSAKKVWVLAAGPSQSLVAFEEPPASLGLKERMLAAKGWVPTRQLQSVDTTDWILPADEVKGQRVYGPLRPKDPYYYLGIGVGADGPSNVRVQRMSDDQVVVVPRSSLRTGRTIAGTKVMTTCGNALKEDLAHIEKEVPQPKGPPLIHLVCDKDGTQKDEVAGALRSKADWLPAHKP